MPGPQFNGDNRHNWFTNYGRRMIIAAVVALIAVGAGYFYKSYQTRTALLKPALDGINSSSNLNKDRIAEQSPVNDQIKGAISSTPTVKKAGDGIVATAVKGNGATHLARQALKEYLKDKPDLAQKLGPEQRIYIEDFLQKRAADQSKTLRIGDQMTFSNDNFQAAIDKALSLNDSQIKNLNKYVPLVPSLMTP